MPMTFRLGGEKIWEIIGTPRSPEAGVLELQNALHESRKFQVTWRGAKQSHVNAALLRIAYLWMFRCFGYGIIIHPFYAQQIHSQIISPDDSILPRSWVLRSDNFPDLTQGIYLVTPPQHLMSFLVVFYLDTGLRQTRHIVILPSTNEDGLAVYEWLQTWGAAKAPVPIDLGLKSIPETEEYITNPDLAFYAQDIFLSR